MRDLRLDVVEVTNMNLMKGRESFISNPSSY